MLNKQLQNKRKLLIHFLYVHYFTLCLRRYLIIKTSLCFVFYWTRLIFKVIKTHVQESRKQVLNFLCFVTNLKIRGNNWLPRNWDKGGNYIYYLELILYSFELGNWLNDFPFMSQTWIDSIVFTLSLHIP